MFRRLKNQAKVQSRSYANNHYVEEVIKKDYGSVQLPTAPEKLDNMLNNVFKDCDDFKCRKLTLPSKQRAHLYFFIGLTDDRQVEQSIVAPLIERTNAGNVVKVKSVDSILASYQYSELKDWPTMIRECLQGNIILHITGMKPYIIKVNEPLLRAISEPTSEPEIYGSKIGFIEHSRSNIGLMRRYVADMRLKVKDFYIGSLTHTHVAMVYINGQADDHVVQEITKKLNKIDVPQVPNTNLIIKELVEQPNSIFPQVRRTERFDQAGQSLLQGRIVILVDNSPFAIILPINLLNFYEPTDDNMAASPWNMLFVRTLRLTCLFISTILPSIYVALVAFHPELIPTTLAMTMAASRNNIPLPAPMEAFLMMFALDVLVEASIRLPNYISQTIGIVGGLVIGQAAVDAGIVSSTMVIVVALTAIAAFTVPSWELAGSWRIIRYLLLLISSLFGLYGLTIGLMITLIHLCSIESYSKPYLAPLSRLNVRRLKDSFIRLKTNIRSGGEKSGNNF
ncbi:spore germination protein [Bacillus suaedae]|uniref:Spore germination protein n=1 Tax=Halalkalibacter suaedae TaxID=2822140 RepID=A0A940WUC9_9BACI|nr:spore germination protein [Bacillus suaedae]MBP3950403.1 spore germination protein [Bacillus suaedae]